MASYSEIVRMIDRPPPMINTPPPASYKPLNVVRFDSNYGNEYEGVTAMDPQQQEIQTILNGLQDPAVKAKAFQAMLTALKSMDEVQQLSQMSDRARVQRFSESPEFGHALKAMGKTPADYVHGYDAARAKIPNLTPEMYGVPAR